MARRRDRTGEQHGKLTVLRLAGVSPSRQSLWECRCQCGNLTTVRADALGKATRSCGCWAVESRRTHGLRRTKVYKVWASMLERCQRKNHPQFNNYGGRGISVCKRWRAFENFYRDMGEPNGRTLDRINVNGNYSPSNCRWASWKTQNRNKTNNHNVIFNGQKMTLAQLAEKQGVCYGTLHSRIRAGWTISEAAKPEKRINQYR